MSEQYPRAALFGTEERTLFSTIRGREYHLSVALPDSYKTSTQAYPVIYVLDGDYNFGVAAGLTRFSNWFRNVPELIIVGIGYAMETSNGDAYAHLLSVFSRCDDLSGGGRVGVAKRVHHTRLLYPHHQAYAVEELNVCRARLAFWFGCPADGLA